MRKMIEVKKTRREELRRDIKNWKRYWREKERQWNEKLKDLKERVEETGKK